MPGNPSIAGRYELGGLLGSGGMGTVYRARDARLGREVAIKVLGEHHAGSAEFVERFEREVKSVASLDHPNVVRVFDSGTGDDGSPYMAMELVDGGTLKDRIRHQGPLPPLRRAALQRPSRPKSLRRSPNCRNRNATPGRVAVRRRSRVRPPPHPDRPCPAPRRSPPPGRHAAVLSSMPTNKAARKEVKA